MKQGDIYLANLDPSTGSEQNGIRPIVIISGNTMIDNLNIVIACPLSSVIKNLLGCVILKPNPKNNLSKESEVITFQIRAVSKKRLIKRIGEISEKELLSIKLGLNDILKY
jgi:mRNA interferase MazF